MTKRVAITSAALGASLLFSSVAFACFCREIRLEDVCGARPPARSPAAFTGQVEAVDASGTHYLVTLRRIHVISGTFGARVQVRMGPTPRSSEITSCDGPRPPAVGDYVLIAMERPSSIYACDLMVPLRDEEQARTPCPAPRGP